jgi:hypothetical protein
MTDLDQPEFDRVGEWRLADPKMEYTGSALR